MSQRFLASPVADILRPSLPFGKHMALINQTTREGGKCDTHDRQSTMLKQLIRQIVVKVRDGPIAAMVAQLVRTSMWHRVSPQSEACVANAQRTPSAA